MAAFGACAGFAVWVSLLAETPPWLPALATGLVAALVHAVMAGSAERTRRTQSRRQGFHLCFPAAQRMALLSGVAIRGVTILNDPVMNAAARCAGRIELTSGLLSGLSAHQLDAVIAHEAGHLSLKRPISALAVRLLRSLALGLGAGGMVVAVSVAAGWPPQVAEMAATLAALAALALGYGAGARARAAEYAADRFAARVLGGPEQIIGALEAMHAADGRANHLSRLEESVSTHPSLDNRRRALQDWWGPHGPA
jgi:Zn-dependent protease with chaperone function